MTKKIFATVSFWYLKIIRKLSHRFDSVTKITIATFILLLLISSVPPITIRVLDSALITVKPLNLYWELTQVPDGVSDTTALDETIDSITGNRSSKALEERAVAESVQSASNTEYSSFIHSITSGVKLPKVFFQDFSEGNAISADMVRKIQKLKSKRENFRIAFLGDSFIESDILTADIRAYLQSYFGGNGVGYVPVASFMSKYRRTVTHNFSSDWKSFSIIKFKEADWDKLTLPGYYHIPAEGSTVDLAIVPSNNKRTVNTAKFMFINERETKITVQINDKPYTTIAPPTKPELQFVTFNGDIQKIKMKFENVKGFTAYGLFLNDESGVYVDNYSVRGSSGIVLSTCSEALSKELNSNMPYDLIVLQYGLNVASANITNYSYYKKKMIAVVKQLKVQFPQSAIMIMGVGDRAMNNSGQFETMPGILAMVNVQKEIAKEAGCMYWNTFEAMGGRNSMANFVKQSLAGKDYTHINHAGGKRIAKSFVYAFVTEIELKSKGAKK